MTTFLKPLKPACLSLFFALMTGILLGNHFPDSRSICFWLVLFLSVLLGLALKYYKKAVFIIMLCLFCCLGYVSIQMKLYPALPFQHVSKHMDSKKKIITGRVVSFATHYEKKQKITLLCRSLETKEGVKKTITGKINLTMYGLSKKVPQFGDTIAFESPIRPIRNFNNPGNFDYERFLKLKGIYASAYTDTKKIKILTPPAHIGLFSQLIRKIERLRINYFHFILKRTQNSNAGKILASLVTGKKEVIPLDIRDLFSKSGVSHLLAISGLHLSIVSGLFFFIFYWTLSCIPALLIPGRSRKIAGLLTLLPLTGYAVFTGFSPSTQRALIMVCVLMLSFISEKEKDLLSSLSVAGILILIIDSSALFSISFQLSFMAVVFIIYGLSLLKKVSCLLKKNLLARMGLMVCVTFFAGLGTLPLTAHYFNMISTIALVSNFILIPVVGFVVLPIGLASLACFSYFPILANFLVQVAHPLIVFAITMSRFLVSVPFSWSRTPTLQWTGIAVIYLFFIVLFMFLNGRKKLPAILVSLLFIGFVFNFSTAEQKNISPGDLTVIIFDVGQGSSSLIQTADGKNILVDGGGFFDNTSFDTGRFILAPFLWLNGIRSLDYVILSHPESDHLNGLVFILNNFDVKTLIKNHDQKNSKSYEDFIKTIKKRNIRTYNPLTKGKLVAVGSAQLIFFDSFNEMGLNDYNNNSLVFRLVYKEFSMLFAGDILSRREESIASRNSFELQSDILLSPHHGSSTSSTKFFLDKVQPKSVIISCGWRNRYRFPHYSVLKRYAGMGINVFRTDEDGAVFISSDGRDHIIKTHNGG